MIHPQFKTEKEYLKFMEETYGGTKILPKRKIKYKYVSTKQQKAISRGDK